MLDRISAVPTKMGASLFTEASPVTRPTFSGPKQLHRSKNFSLTRALTGQL